MQEYEKFYAAYSASSMLTHMFYASEAKTHFYGNRIQNNLIYHWVKFLISDCVDKNRVKIHLYYVQR